MLYYIRCRYLQYSCAIFTWNQSAIDAKCMRSTISTKIVPFAYACRPLCCLRDATFANIASVETCKITTVLESLDSELQQKLLDICLGVLVTWIFVGGWLQIIERWKQEDSCKWYYDYILCSGIYL